MLVSAPIAWPKRRNYGSLPSRYTHSLSFSLSLSSYDSVEGSVTEEGRPRVTQLSNVSKISRIAVSIYIVYVCMCIYLL